VNPPRVYISLFCHFIVTLESTVLNPGRGKSTYLLTLLFHHEWTLTFRMSRTACLRARFSSAVSSLTRCGGRVVGVFCSSSWRRVRPRDVNTSDGISKFFVSFIGFAGCYVRQCVTHSIAQTERHTCSYEVIWQPMNDTASLSINLLKPHSCRKLLRSMRVWQFIGNISANKQLHGWVISSCSNVLNNNTNNSKLRRHFTWWHGDDDAKYSNSRYFNSQ